MAVDSLVWFLGLFAWVYPLFLLTYVAYHIQAATKFKTRWRWFLAAAVASIVHLPIAGSSLVNYVSIPSTQLLVVNIMLCLSLIAASYASLALVRFQKISLGKTKTIILFLLSVGLLLPALLAASGKLALLTSLNLLLYNTSMSLMIFMYLAVGKTARNYLPQLSNLSYALTRLASIILFFEGVSTNRLQMLSLTIVFGSTQMITGGLSYFIAAILLTIPSLLLVNEAKVRGLPIKASREEMRGVRAEYRLKGGSGYLIVDSDDKDLRVFVDYVANNYHGLCLTRARPSEIREKYSLRTTPILWFTNAKTDEKTIKPDDLLRMKKIVSDFIESTKKPIILVQRLDYLIAQNDFKSVLKLIEDLNDMVMSKDSILLVSVKRSTLADGEFSLLEQELKLIESTQKLAMPSNLYELLDFIHTENNLNKTPSFKDVSVKFSINKTTVRTRVHDLQRRGLIRVQSEGRYKLLELTERGRTLILSSILKTGG